MSSAVWLVVILVTLDVFLRVIGVLICQKK